ncbi:MAG: hypothetical protein CVU84_03415 [Firmicutes bacterium HGW-Firmicutes-1]|jgi:stage III sporulation protein AG|nr:MAG: hypothetical protein CVU84_03415 [Firmicutes bacterium HGW-Firmicutes-1]
MNFKLPSIQNNKQKRIINLLFIIFCIGFAFVIFYKQNTSEEQQPNKQLNTAVLQEEDTIHYSDAIEKKLEIEFEKIDGVGSVDVLLTMKTKGEVVLNKDSPNSSSKTTEKDKEGGSRESEENDQQQITVMIKKGDGSEEPIIIKELLPEVNGILIIAEGGDDLIVKNNLINAAKVLLDLPAHKIEVMKRVPN